MRIVVCAKQISMTYARTGMDPEQHYINPEDMINRVNPYDESALEIALRIKDYRDDAEIIIAAFGLCSRIAKKATDLAREKGMKVGIFRPITVWPFPLQALGEMASRDHVKFFLSVEMNAGQMVEDVKLAVCGQKPVYFYGRMGGIIPTPDEILGEIRKLVKREGE